MRITAGPPVDLDDLQGQEITTQLLAIATERIMAAITALLEEIRGEQAPAKRFDPRTAGVSEIGNPNKPRKYPPREPRRRADPDGGPA
jgi:hypothetical protein